MPPKTARIEVFRPGTFTPMEGEAVTYSAADLKALADAYNPETAPAPIVIGHPTTDAPAYGWATGFAWDATEGVLTADLGEIDPAFAEAVNAGRYKKISLCLFAPTSPANPTPGAWYPKHIGFLGGAAPAVSGLRNAAFAALPSGETVTFTASFGDRSGEQAASLFRKMRDFMIEQFGLDQADKALPSWEIEWLGEADPVVGYAAPPVPPQPPVVTTPVVTPPVAAFAAREAELAAREAALAAREVQTQASDNAAFAAGLVAEGRLLPAMEARIVAILNGLPGHAVSFAEGEAPISAGQALRAVLAELPVVVSFGRVNLPPGGDQTVSAFAADGAAVDPVALELHHRAEAYQREHPNTPYLAAVRAVS